MKQFLTFLLILGIYASSTPQVNAQELNAKVLVKVQAELKLAEPQMFRTLENEIREFFNDRKWTDDTFRPEERIDCSILITIVEEVSQRRFKAHATIQSSRPVYNTAYPSVLFNYQDKAWEFEYAEYEPLEFNENAYLQELSSLLAYYAYIIIGTDYDTFSESGGTPHYLKAQTIVNNSQNNPKALSSGWDVFDDANRSRYWLVENLLNAKYKPYRLATYNYHRKGLDTMLENDKKARTSILSALNLVEQTYSSNSNSMLVDVFIASKSNEIIELFGNYAVPTPDRMKAYNFITKIDAANTQKYEGMTNPPNTRAMSQGAQGMDRMERSPVKR